MEPHLHRVEVELAVARDHDLAIERRVGRHQLADRAELGEVPEQRPSVARPECDLVAVPFEHAAEAVPLRFVAPGAGALRQFRDELGLHRWERHLRAKRVGALCVGHGYEPNRGHERGGLPTAPFVQTR
jgi:hypothetical protein